MAITTLPDPNNTIDTTGSPGAGSAGPGYSAVSIQSNQPIMRSRTNSGRVVTRGVASQFWEVSLSYNPSTRANFEVINTYLLNKRGGLVAFLVSLPQYLIPQDAALVTDPLATSLASAGDTTIAYSVAAGTPTRGDMFVVEDPLDSAHTKAYIVTGYDAGPIVHFSPPLSKEVSSGSTLRFQDPKLRVIMASDTQEHRLNKEGLYSFSLKLEEAQA